MLPQLSTVMYEPRQQKIPNRPPKVSRVFLFLFLAFQVVQQLLRHGADLHSLDQRASKPLDFRKYFEERRDNIMQAVQDTLQYK